MNTDKHGSEMDKKAHRGVAEIEVAQNCFLLYRGFVIRWPPPNRTIWPPAALRRMQFGDTADCKSALRVRRRQTGTAKERSKYYRPKIFLCPHSFVLPAENRTRQWGQRNFFCFNQHVGFDLSIALRREKTDFIKLCGAPRSRRLCVLFSNQKIRVHPWPSVVRFRRISQPRDLE